VCFLIHLLSVSLQVCYIFVALTLEIKKIEVYYRGAVYFQLDVEQRSSRGERSPWSHDSAGAQSSSRHSRRTQQ